MSRLDIIFWCDWSSAGNSNVTGNFFNLSSPKEGADTCPGGSVENQSNDYSFNPSASDYTDWNRVTLYISNNMAKIGFCNTDVIFGFSYNVINYNRGCQIVCHCGTLFCHAV